MVTMLQSNLIAAAALHSDKVNKAQQSLLETLFPEQQAQRIARDKASFDEIASLDGHVFDIGKDPETGALKARMRKLDG